MQIIKKLSGTVLVYTMVLVTLGVFMATVVLNIATELSIEYDIRNIEVSLVNTIQTKGDLAMKYARELNETGSGFIDNIGCPTNFTMSGSTARTVGISSVIRYSSGALTPYCQGTHNGNDVIFYFDNNFTDLKFAEYDGYQVLVDTGNQTQTFSDSDSTFIDLTASYPLSADGIDDNFDSDNFDVFSTGSIYYPDNYADNDADSRLLNYGYIIENSGFYNVLWTNSEMKDYIRDNSNNSDTLNTNLGNTSTGALYLDINENHRLLLYRMDQTAYDTTKEFIVDQLISGTGQIANIGYLQDDLSLSAVKTGSEYIFDFTAYDYALFVENTSSGALLYRIRGEDNESGSGVYINPLQDDDGAIFGYLGSHVLVDDTGRLIGNQFEVFGLK